MSARKEEVITFKVDRELADRIRGVANRSAFIRNAILAALENSCPVCGGTGVLSAHQVQHWQEFAKSHHVEECPDCKEVHLVCDHDAHGHEH
jgi:hypothetical protein